MASAVDNRLAYARLSAVATASRLPTANRGSNNSYTTSWDTTEDIAALGSNAAAKKLAMRHRNSVQERILSASDQRCGEYKNYPAFPR